MRLKNLTGLAKYNNRQRNAVVGYAYNSDEYLWLIAGKTV